MERLLYSIIFLGMVSIFIILISDNGDTKLQKALEEAYFEGQKDAINGDVRISKHSDSCWVWTKSCWDSGRKPLFNPCKLK